MKIQKRFLSHHMSSHRVSRAVGYYRPLNTLSQNPAGILPPGAFAAASDDLYYTIYTIYGDWYVHIFSVRSPTWIINDMFKNCTCWCLTSPHLLVGAFLGAPFVPLSSPTFTPHQVIIWFWWCVFCGALPWTSLDWVPTTSAEVQELLLLCARFVPRPGKLMGQECIEVDTIGWYWMLRNGQPVSTWTPPMWRKSIRFWSRMASPKSECVSQCGLPEIVKPLQRDPAYPP